MRKRPKDKKSSLKILFILDPLEKLNIEIDTSLYLIKEFHRRAHRVWALNTSDLESHHRGVSGLVSRYYAPSFKNTLPLSRRDFKGRFEEPKRRSLLFFDLILIRKEPPFDDSYLYLTHGLERIVGKVAIANHPRGIRANNEKLSILNFPKLIPPTFVSANPELLLRFQNQIHSDLVIKPLESCAGKGVFLLRRRDKARLKKLQKATARGRKTLMAQKFIRNKPEKRISLLDGKVLTAYLKKGPKNDFRTNIHVGGTVHPTQVTSGEKKIIRALRPYLKKEGLSFVGLDLIGEKLIEINVTCPGALLEAKGLYPFKPLVETWANSLERLVKTRAR